MPLANNVDAIKYILAITFLSIASTAMAENISLNQYQPELTDKFKNLLHAATPEDGEMDFTRKCSSCHDLKQNASHGKGPNLWNVFGRKAGSIPGFEFSAAMKSSGHTWNLATLNHYLTDTEQAIPGRTMNFRGIRQDKVRAGLLRYLMQFNSNPPALP